jgi:photosystem II stability/assembly factor-like uncharacterized protein
MGQHMTLRSFFVHLLALCVVGTTLHAGEFDRIKDNMKAVYTTVNPDGSVRVAKQFSRWEYFWERRLLPNGDFPTSAQYMSEALGVERQRSRLSEDQQAIPTWKEVGPEAPATIDQSQWNGIGRVNCMAFSYQNDNLLWVGSAAGGLWKSTNNGGNWTYVPVAGYPMFGVSDIQLAKGDDKIIYVATGDAETALPGILTGFPVFSYGVIKSVDGGLTWSSTGLSYNPESNNVVCKLWVNPADPNVVVAATSGGMQRSTDGGKTFSITSNGYFKDVVGHPTNANILYSATFSISGGASVYKSVDMGKTWTKMYSRPTANRLRLGVTEANPKLLVVLASNASTNGLDNVFRSTDEGISYVAMNPNVNLLGWSANGNDTQGQGFYDLSLEISPIDASQIFVGGVNIWRTANASGTSWALSAHWTGGGGADFVHADHHSFRYNPNNGLLYACHDGGIAVSENDGQNWRDISRGLRIQQFYGLAVSNLNTSLILCGAQDNGTTRFQNGTARNVFDGDGMKTAIDWSNAQTMYTSNPNGTFFRSDNGGSNFTFISSQSRRGEEGSWVTPIAIDPKNSATVYLGYQNLWRSDNYGASFVKLTPLNVPATLRVIAVAPSDPKYLYVAYTQSMYVSSDGGTSWSQQSGVSGFITDIKVHPTNPRRVWVTYGGFVGGNKVIEINNGVVTNITGNTLPNVPANAIVFQPGVLNRLYLGTDLGVYFRDEGMKEWQPFGKEMPMTVISDLAIVSTTNKLRAATYGRGVWEIDAVQCKATTPTVTAVTPTNVCSGDSVVLEAAAGYRTYTWSNGDTSRRITLVAQSQSGDYSVSVEDDNGCRGLSTTTAVVIRRTPVKPTITKRTNDTLRATSIGVTGYQWFVDGTKIDGATTRDILAKWVGSYRVEVTNSDKCTSISEPFSYTPVSSDVADDVRRSTLLAVYPNPFEQRIEVRKPDHADLATLELVDMRGLLIKSLQFDESVITVELTDLASGAYIVRVRSGAAVWSAPIVKR